MNKISNKLPELVEDINELMDNVTVDEKANDVIEVKSEVKQEIKQEIKPEVKQEVAEEVDESDVDVEKYMERFDHIEKINSELGKLIDKLNLAEHDQARVTALTSIVKVQYLLNTDLLTQLREMNNIFA